MTRNVRGKRQGRSSSGGPRRSAVGGSASEAGGDYRAAVAAWLVALGLTGRDVEGVGLRTGRAVPALVSLETDEAVDDVKAEMADGRLLVQAKRDLTLGSAAFRDTVRQWVDAVCEGGVDRERDRLLLVTESSSAPLMALGRALDRRRRTDPGAPSLAEQRALDVLLKMLGALTADERELVLDVAVIAQVELLSPNARHRVLATELLDLAVVQAGEGSQAFEDLKTGARSAAIRRHGRVLREWRELLQDAGRRLRADPAGGLSARATAIETSLDDYRLRLQEQGRHLSLLELGVTIPAVPLSDPASSWQVLTPSEDGRPHERDLGPAIRRRGRIVLLGPPGAGKSSALRQLAGAWAADRVQPVPILVPLQRFRSGSLPPDLADLVRHGEDVPQDDDLIAELAKRLGAGEAALFLDGLDESRDRRFEVVAHVSRLLRDLDAGTHVVISTRDVAYAAAETLGWDGLPLMMPRDMDDVLAAVARALAERDGVPEPERRRWIDDHLTSLREFRLEHPVLGETPLLSVLALVMLAGRSSERVPATRALLLSALVDDVTERLELRVRRASERWPRHSREEVIRLLRESFDFVGHRVFLATEVPRNELLNALAARIEVGWGFAAGMASAAADTLLNFWDEAGVFVAGGHPPRVTGRVAGLVELAEARFASQQDQRESARWVEQMAEEATSTEALLLGAGLSPAIAEALVSQAADKGGNASLIAADAVRRGARVTDTALARLIGALESRIRSDPDTASAKALARLPVPAHLREEVIAALEAIEDERDRALSVAIAMDRWEIPLERAEPALRRALRTPPPAGMFVDEGWIEGVAAAARRLLEAGRGADDEILEAYQHVSQQAEERLDAILSRHGRSDLRRRAETHRYDALDAAPLLRSMAERDALWGRVFDHLAEAAAPSLSREQARRLAELGDLAETVAPNDAPASWFEHALRHPAELLRAFDLALVLGGFDPGIVGAQARIARDMTRLDATIFLHDSAERRPLSRWDAVDIDFLRAELIQLMRVGPLFAHFAANALLEAPGRQQTVELIEEVLPSLRVESRRIASSLILELDATVARATTWLRDDDPVRRLAAAKAIGQIWSGGGVNEALLEAAATSSDSGVRAALFEAVAQAGGRIPDKVQSRMDAQPAAGWQCKWCGVTNSADRESCSDCRIVGNANVSPGSTLRARVSGTDSDAGDAGRNP